MFYDDVKQDKTEGIGQVEQEPDVNRLGVGGLGHHRGEEDVQRREDGHTGDVGCQNGLKEAVAVNVHGGLVDDVHHDGGKVCGQEES